MAVPDHIKKFNRMHKKSEKIIATTKLHGSEAYNTAAKEYLKDEKGLIDYEKLEDEKTAEKFGEGIAKEYLKHAKKAFKSNVSETDDFENDMLLQAYAGITKSALVDRAREKGKDFNLDDYHNFMFDERRNPNAVIGQIRQRLAGTATSHLRQEHVDDIVKYVKADKFVDSNKMARVEAVNMLLGYKQVGTVSPDDHKNKMYAKKSYYQEKRKEAA